jgi:hypothetical protein
MSGSPVANPKSDPDYSVFITFFFNFMYPVKYFRLPWGYAYRKFKTTGLEAWVSRLLTWDTMPCSVTDMYLVFRGTCRHVDL